MAEDKINTTPDESSPKQIYDPEHVQLLAYLRISRVEVVPNQGGGDLVEVRAESNAVSDEALWRSLRWHCRQGDAPKAGEVFQLLIAAVNYDVTTPEARASE